MCSWKTYRLQKWFWRYHFRPIENSFLIDSEPEAIVSSSITAQALAFQLKITKILLRKNSVKNLKENSFSSFYQTDWSEKLYVTFFDLSWKKSKTKEDGTNEVFILQFCKMRNTALILILQKTIQI